MPSKRPTDLSLSNHGWQNHRRVRPDTLSGRLLQVERLNQESILVEIVRPSILATTWITRDARPQQRILFFKSDLQFNRLIITCVWKRTVPNTLNRLLCKNLPLHHIQTKIYRQTKECNHKQAIFPTLFDCFSMLTWLKRHGPCFS